MERSSATRESWPRNCSMPEISTARRTARPRSLSGTSTTTTTAGTAAQGAGHQHLDSGRVSLTSSPHTSRVGFKRSPLRHEELAMSEQDSTQNSDSAPAGEPEAVVVGIDGSPPSRNALAWAIQEARSLHRPIRLGGAYTMPSVAAAALDVSYVPIDDSSIRAAVTNTLKEAAAEVKAAGVPVEAVIEIGDAAGVLIDESKTGCLSVVGSRGRGGFAGRLLGTVSSALPAHSACPTVVVPASWEEGSDRPAHPTSSRPIRQDGREVEGYDSNAEAVEGLR